MAPRRLHVCVANMVEGKMGDRPLMPWKPGDAKKHDKKADCPKKQRQWAFVANRVLFDTGDEGRAIREANATVAKDRKGCGSERPSKD